MPISILELDASTKEESITLILGKTILLKIIEDPEKRKLLESSVVKRLVSIPDLCQDDIRLGIEGLLEKENALIRMSVPTFFEAKTFNLPTGKLKTLEESFTIKIPQTRKQEFSEAFLDKFSDFMCRLTGKIDKKYMKKQDAKMVLIGDKLKKKTNLEFLTPSNFLLCPKCKVILFTKEFDGYKKCPSCKEEIKREKADRIYLHKVRLNIKKVWEKGRWFEAYFTRLLRNLGWKTWTDVHVMGASGILHEVDVLAIRKGTVLACECKTGKVSRNDVFNFCTKASDLKAHISIIALIEELPEPQTREFLKKNPVIIRIEGMGKKKENEVLNDLKQRLLIKG